MVTGWVPAALAKVTVRTVPRLAVSGRQVAPADAHLCMYVDRARKHYRALRVQASQEGCDHH